MTVSPFSSVTPTLVSITLHEQATHSTLLPSLELMLLEVVQEVLGKMEECTQGVMVDVDC